MTFGLIVESYQYVNSALLKYGYPPYLNHIKVFLIILKAPYKPDNGLTNTFYAHKILS